MSEKLTWATVIVILVLLCTMMVTGYVSGQPNPSNRRDSESPDRSSIIRSPCKYHVYPYLEFSLHMPCEGDILVKYVSKKGAGYVHWQITLSTGENLLMRFHPHGMAVAVVAQSLNSSREDSIESALLRPGFSWGMSKELLEDRLGTRMRWSRRQEFPAIDEGEIVSILGNDYSDEGGVAPGELHVVCLMEEGRLTAVEEWLVYSRHGGTRVSHRCFGSYPEYSLPE